MVKGTDVLNKSSEYQKVLNDCKNKFSELGSFWEGTSYSQLSGKVDNFVVEAGLVTTQMNSLANACSQYEKYVELAKENSLLRASDNPDDATKIDENVRQMKICRTNAISYLNEISGVIQYSALTDTDHVPSVSISV